MLCRRSALGLKPWGCVLAGALLVGTLWAFWPAAAPVAGAEGRNPPPPRAFLSGGERSEIILREIAEILRRIDGRLERLEKAVFEAAEPAGSSAGEPVGSTAPAASDNPNSHQP